MFRKNIDTTGRVLRLTLAILLFAYAIWQHSWIALALAVFTLFESFMSWCILYQILGKNSCPIETDKKNEK